MNEKSLSDALLRGEDQIDVEALTERILRRDRRRMWFLGIACVIAWMLVVMLPWGTTLPMLAKVVEHQVQLSRNPTTATSGQEQAESIEVLQIVKRGTMATFFGSIASMLLAAVCTVLLVTLSRRATLRQVNARLRELSRQIKALPGK